MNSKTPRTSSFICEMKQIKITGMDGKKRIERSTKSQLNSTHLGLPAEDMSIILYQDLN